LPIPVPAPVTMAILSDEAIVLISAFRDWISAKGMS
jgi:hypothetical protein